MRLVKVLRDVQLVTYNQSNSKNAIPVSFIILNSRLIIHYPVNRWQLSLVVTSLVASKKLLDVKQFA